MSNFSKLGSVACMIRKNGRYILNVNDFLKICKHYKINPNAVSVMVIPGMEVAEYRFYDIYTDGELVSFYDHDGLFRTRKNKTDYYTEPIEVVLRNQSQPPVEMLEAIKKNTNTVITRVKQKINESHEQAPE